MKSRRAGFTLVELLMVTFIGALVLAAVLQTLTVQDRSIRQSYAVISMQQNTRTAIDVLSTDLREVSATDGDILDGDSIFISVRALRKAGVVCHVDPGGNYLEVAEIGDAFDSADSLLIFVDGANPEIASDDSWVTAQLTSTPSATTCTSSAVSATVRRLNVVTPLTGVLAGALVRSWVPVRYRLVDQGSEGMLTRIESPDSVPLVGHLSTIQNQGLRFRYWDTLNVAMPIGTLSANRQRIGRIQVKVRGTAVGGVTGTNREVTDSLVSTVQLRGNRKLR